MRKITSTLIAVVLALLALGIVILASTSSVEGTVTFDNPLYFFYKQLQWLLLSVFAGFLCLKFDYHYWQRLAPFLAIAAALLLVAVFLPGIGVKVGGSHRWIKLGPLSFQSSEAAKFALVIALAAWLAHAGRKVERVKEGLILPGVGLAVAVVLLMAEPDFGTTILVASVWMAMLFVAGTKLHYLVVAGAAGFSGMLLMLMQSEVRWMRMMAFMHPEDPEYASKAYHVIQSKIAFYNGGWSGAGLGNSMQKRLYLPEAHTDFIFAIIGEELGMIFTIGVVLAYVILLVCGIIISLRAPDLFGRLLGFGFIIMIVLQAFINIAVVTGSVPTKGIPLPFISYGGSSLMMSIASICVILNIAGHCERSEKDVHTNPIKNRMRRF